MFVSLDQQSTLKREVSPLQSHPRELPPCSKSWPFSRSFCYKQKKLKTVTGRNLVTLHRASHAKCSSALACSCSTFNLGWWGLTTWTGSCSFFRDKTESRTGISKGKYAFCTPISSQSIKGGGLIMRDRDACLSWVWVTSHIGWKAKGLAKS